MEEQKDFEKELAKKLKQKKIRKYALIVLVLAAVVYAASIFTIEDKDALLADGQGNVIDYQQEAEDRNTEAEQQAEEQDTEKQDGEVSDPDNQDDQDSQGSEAGDASDSSSREDGSSGKDSTSGKDSSSSDKSGSENSDSEKKPTKEEAANMTAEELKVDNSEDPTASNDGNAAYRPDVAQPVTVTISIRCDTLSSDMSQLENPAIKDYIPEDGCILDTTTYMGTTDNTVFDVLNTVCRNNDVQLEFNFTPVYESYYIEGINYLYEFDGGNLSGWMYKVNGWFPNYGCSSYYLSDGDVIEWVYTCDLGKDVGDNSMS